MGDILELYRERKLKPLTQKVDFDISDLPAAVQSVSQTDFYDRCILEYNTESQVPVSMKGTQKMQHHLTILEIAFNA